MIGARWAKGQLRRFW